VKENYVGRDELSSEERHLGIVRISQREKGNWLQMGVC